MRIEQNYGEKIKAKWKVKQKLFDERTLTTEAYLFWGIKSFGQSDIVSIFFFNIFVGGHIPHSYIQKRNQFAQQNWLILLFFHYTIKCCILYCLIWLSRKRENDSILSEIVDILRMGKKSSWLFGYWCNVCIDVTINYFLISMVSFLYLEIFPKSNIKLRF